MQPSLRLTLFRWLLVPLFGVATLGSVAQYSLNIWAAQDALDSALVDEAVGLATKFRVEGGNVRYLISPNVEAFFRVDTTDAIFYEALNAAGAHLAGDRGVPAGSKPALGRWVAFDASMAGTSVRVIAYGAPCGEDVCELRVAETQKKRAEVAQRSAWIAIGTMLLLAISIWVFSRIAVRRSLDALSSVREQLVSQSLANLAPLPTHGIPLELHPVVGGVNHLIDRVTHANDLQQKFIADAAHQLRTPIAALTTRLELAVLDAQHKRPCPEALAEINHLAQRAGRLANQLLLLARTESGALSSASTDVIDLKVLGSEIALEWGASHLVKGQDLGFELMSARVSGHKFLLLELVNNLLHNAVTYAGPRARITLRTAVVAGAGVIELEDDGPGIPRKRREAMFGRFVRGNENQASGSGLGLAIVRDIAHLHGAQVELLDPPGRAGLLVRVAFPPLPETGGKPIG